MADHGRDADAARFERAGHRREAVAEVDERRLPAFREPVAGVVEHDGLEARVDERRDERVELRAAPSPAVAQDHRRAIARAEAPRRQARACRVHDEALARREKGTVAVANDAARRREEEPHGVGDGALGRDDGTDLQAGTCRNPLH